MRGFWSLWLLLSITVACSDPPQLECEAADDCAPGFGCLDRRCVAVEPCVGDGDCGPRQICLWGVCDVRQCVADAACGRRRVCFDGWCGGRPAGYCTTDEECAPSVCDLNTHRCLVAIVSCADGGCPDAAPVGECEMDEGCPTGRYCAQGRCLEGCRLIAGDCGEGRACDPESRRCSLQPCGVDGDCPPDRYCTDQGVCRVGCRREDEACGDGTCDEARRRCVGARCLQGIDCPPDQVCALDLLSGPLRCRLSEGEAPPAAPCEAAEDCASRWCVDGQCFTACVSDERCPGARCAPVNVPADDGAVVTVLGCRPILPPCAADDECPADTRCVPGPAGRPLALDLHCAPAAGLGAYASTDDADACDSGLALDGRCWGPCRLEGDDCPPGERCYAAELYLTDDRGTLTRVDDLFAGLAACAPARGSGDPCPETACPDGEVCVPRPDRDRTGFRGECRTPLGPGLGATPCVEGEDCQSGWCLGGCVERCRPHGVETGCSPAATCAEISLPVWDRGTPDDMDDPTAEVFICVAP